MTLNYTYEEITTESQIDNLLQQSLKNGIVAFDYETSGLDAHSGKPLLLQFGLEVEPEVYHCYILRALNCIGTIKEKVKEILESRRIEKIGQNLKFEWEWSYVHYGIDMAYMWDTMITESALTMGKPLLSSLENIALRRLDIQLDKFTQKSFINMKQTDEFTDRQIKYAAEDVAVIFPLYHQQKKEVEEWGLKNIVKLENSVIPIIAEFHTNGVLLDMEQWDKAMKEYERERLPLLKKFHEILGLPPIKVPEKKNVQISMFEETDLEEASKFNVADEILLYEKSTGIQSTKQLIANLHNLGLEVESTDKKALEALKGQHPVVEILQEEKIVRQLLTFFRKTPLLINKTTGRLHPNYVQLPSFESNKTGTKIESQGASTSRLGCNSPNIQQMPKVPIIRHSFIARKGHKIITADFSSMEVCIAGNASIVFSCFF